MQFLLVSCLTLDRQMLSSCIQQLQTEKIGLYNLKHGPHLKSLEFQLAKVEFFPQKGHNGCQRNPHIKFVYHSLSKPFNLQLVWLHMTMQRVLRKIPAVTLCGQLRFVFLHCFLLLVCGYESGSGVKVGIKMRRK